MRDSSTLFQRLLRNFVAKYRVHELVEHVAVLDHALPHSPFESVSGLLEDVR